MASGVLPMNHSVILQRHFNRHSQHGISTGTASTAFQPAQPARHLNRHNQLGKSSRRAPQAPTVHAEKDRSSAPWTAALLGCQPLPVLRYQGGCRWPCE